MNNVPIKGVQNNKMYAKEYIYFIYFYIWYINVLLMLLLFTMILIIIVDCSTVYMVLFSSWCKALCGDGGRYVWDPHRWCIAAILCQNALHTFAKVNPDHFSSVWCFNTQDALWHKYWLSVFASAWHVVIHYGYRSQMEEPEQSLGGVAFYFLYRLCDLVTLTNRMSLAGTGKPS